MEKIIVINEQGLLNVKEGHNLLLYNTMRLMYFMFETSPKEIYFSLHTRDSLKVRGALEIVLRWENLNQPERLNPETSKETCAAIREDGLDVAQ